MNVRVFQMVSAFAQIDNCTGRLTIVHFDNLMSMTFDACEWRCEVEHADIERARALIAEHLNACPMFSWPLLPHVPSRPTNIPPLKPRDVLPGEYDETLVMKFGVVADAFEVEEAM